MTVAEFVSDSTKCDAIDILTTYVDFIRNEVRADDFERHPYVPHIEQTIEDLRAAPPAMDREAVDRDELAKRLFWADVLLGDHPERLQPEWRDRWWDEISTMPLSGPGFLRKWRALADAALSTLSADAIRQGERELRDALQALENACDDLAANRSGETYRNMIDCDRATPYLHALDDARRNARALLRRYPATPASDASDGGEGA